MVRQSDQTRGGERAPKGEATAPTRMAKSSWWGALRRTFREFSADNVSDLAAALTYYAILSLFPALLVLVSLLGLAGPNATRTLTENASALLPQDVAGLVNTAIENLQGSQGVAGLVGIVSLAVALSTKVLLSSTCNKNLPQVVI